METKIMVRVVNGWAGEGDAVKYYLTGEVCKIDFICEESNFVHIVRHDNSYYADPEKLELI